MATKAQKVLDWFKDWAVRPSETEVLEQEIAYYKSETKRLEEDNTRLRFLKESGYDNLYEAYKASMEEHQKMSFDTF